MPIDFLTDEHLHTYATFHRDLTLGDLETRCQLSQQDQKLIFDRRSDHSRLGFAIQLCTLRLLHTFPNDFSTTPAVLVDYVAQQLEITPDVLPRYLERRNTRFEHQREIREYLGYREFNGVHTFGAIRFLLARLAVADERPIALFQALVAELQRTRVELAGASTLTRLILKTRERVAIREHRRIASRLSAAQIARLEALLVANPRKHRLTPLQQLRDAPTSVSAPGIIEALERLERIRKIGVGNVDLSDVPESRLLSLARQAEGLWSANFDKFSPTRRLATLLALIQHLERTATDDVLTIFEAILAELNLRGEQRRRKEALSNLPALRLEALRMREALLPVIDKAIPDTRVRAAILERLGVEELTSTLERVAKYATSSEREVSEVWEKAAQTLSSFFVRLITDLKLEGTLGAKDLLEALRWLKRTSGTAPSTWGKPPRAFIPSSWLSIVFPNGTLSRSAYQICAAQQLFQHLKRREVYILRSTRYTDPRAQLFEGDAWKQAKADVCRSLGLSEQPKATIEALSNTLNATYRRTVANLPNNTLVRMELEDGMLTPKITPVKALPVTDSMRTLVKGIDSRLPEIDLPELVLEINARNDFVGAMLETSDAEPLAEDVATSIVAVLVAQACNIGLKAVSNEAHPALKRSRLQWVKQRYVTLAAITRANHCLVEDHSRLELVKHWGGGEIASADRW